MLEGKRIARQGSAVYSGETHVGEVTSGTFSPTLQVSLAMAYVDPAARKTGTKLAVDVRGHREPARVVKLPFYKRARKSGVRDMTFAGQLFKPDPRPDRALQRGF